MKKILVFILLILSLTSLVFADTNGIWNYASDMRPGVFGSNEYDGEFSFKDNLTINGSSQTFLKINSPNNGFASYLTLFENNIKQWSVGQNPIWSVGSNDFYIYEDGTLSGSNINGLVIRKGTGNVGIGTTTPSAKLEVIGNVIANDPTQDNHLATKKYVDENAGSAPMGAISAFNLASCPTGWILADGGAGSPDLRGVFIRGLDLGRGIDVGRILGSYQDDELESHRHGLSAGTVGLASGTGNHGGDMRSSKSGLSSNYFGGTETRPKNVALIYCMKVGSSPLATVGILSESPTTVFLTDNSKDFEVGGDIFMGGDKVATEDYVNANSGSSICDFGGFYERNTPAVTGNNNCRVANLATGSCSCPSGYTRVYTGQIWHNQPWDGSIFGCYKC